MKTSPLPDLIHHAVDCLTDAAKDYPYFFHTDRRVFFGNRVIDTTVVLAIQEIVYGDSLTSLRERDVESRLDPLA